MSGEGNLEDVTGAAGGGNAKGVVGGAPEHPGELEHVEEVEWFFPTEVPGEDPSEEVDPVEEPST